MGEELLGSGALSKEPLAGAGVFEVGLETEGELEEPGPLALHGQHVSLNDLTGWVVGDDQRLSAVHHRTELRLSLLKLRHQFLSNEEY